MSKITRILKHSTGIQLAEKQKNTQLLVALLIKQKQQNFIEIKIKSPQQHFFFSNFLIQL